MYVHDAVLASQTHRAARYFEWEDRKLFGRQTRRYALIVTLWSQDDMKRHGHDASYDDEFYVISFTGDAEPILGHFSSRDL